MFSFMIKINRDRIFNMISPCVQKTNRVKEDDP